MVRRLRVIHTPTPDWEQVRAFYRDVLGLPETGGWDQPGDRGAFLAAGSGEIEVMEQNAAALGILPEGAGGWQVALQVESADAEHARLSRHEGVILTGIRERPWGSRDFLIRDPAGNPVLIFDQPA